jgi:tetratricopeptide (TPR) repeat protein
MTNEPFVDLSTDEPRPRPVDLPGVERLPVSEHPAAGATASSRRPAKGGRRPSGGAAPAPVEEIDLTSALGNLDNIAPTASDSSEKLEEVFEEIRAGVEDDDAEFAAQYLKLASTYIEMGMLDDAVSSLKTAVKSPSHRFEAASMLGRLYMRRSETPQAIEWLEHAAEEPAPTPEDGRALLYDLGILLDQTGEIARALAVFLELQADAGDYRDVPARIDRLARVQSGG